MKKFLAFTLTFALALSLISCGNNQAGPVQTGPVFSIENDAYLCTPDEFVLALRETIARVEGVDFTPREIPLPSEVKSDATKYYRFAIIPKQLIVEFSTNDYGYVKRFDLEWTGTTEASNNVSLIVFAVVNMLMPSNVDEILRGFDFAVIDEKLYDVSSDGTTFYLFGKATTGFYLWIHPDITPDSN